MRKPSSKTIKYKTEDQSADPLLFFMAVTLFTILAICEFDRHGNTLGEICQIVSSGGTALCIIGP
jgi:hypothetical protein